TFELEEQNPIAEATKQTEFYFDFSEKSGVSGIHIIDNSFAYIEDAYHLNQVTKLLNFRQNMNVARLHEWFLGRGAIEIFGRFRGCIPFTEFIPQFRQIQENAKYEFNGGNLIKE